MSDKTPERIIETARKLLALAEQGATEGEKEAARGRLDALLEKHGLTLDDLSEEKREWVKFMVKDEFEFEILFQCIFKVLNTKKVQYLRKKKNKSLQVQLTPAEHTDVKTLFAYYRAVWEEEVADFLIAFMSKHRLYSESSASDTEESPMDYMRLKKLKAMMQGMRELPNPLLKQLARGEDA